MSDPRPDRVRNAEDTIIELHREIERLRAVNADMLAALRAVEEWWLSDGMKHFTGAPYAIFATRAVIAKADVDKTAIGTAKP